MKEFKIRNQYNAPKGKKQNVHQEIYEYDYIDRKTGEVVHRKINTQEKIQSSLERVNYKKMIMNGELQINDNIMGKGIRDFTSVPGNKVDFIDFIAKIGSMDAGQIDNLIKSLAEKPQDEPSKNREKNNETVVTTTKTESDNSGNTTKTDEGNQ